MYDTFFNLPRKKKVKLFKSGNIADNGKVRLNLSGEHDSLFIGTFFDCFVQITPEGINKQGLLSVTDNKLLKDILNLININCKNCRNGQFVNGYGPCCSCDENYCNFVPHPRDN